MNTAAARKTKMMQASIRCLVFGLLAFVPAIGLFFAAASLVTSGRVRRMEKEFWNPAKTYRVVGVICAIVATVMWVSVAGVIGLIAYQNSSGGCCIS